MIAMSPLISLVLVILVLLLMGVALVMAYGELELESMVRECAGILLTVQTGSTNSNLIEDAAGLAVDRELQIGFTKKVIEVTITNPTGAAQTVTLFAADPANQERTVIKTILVAAGVTVTVELNDVEKPYCKVQPDDLTPGVGVDRWQTQLRANQTNIAGGGLTVSARVYDSKYPY